MSVLNEIIAELRERRLWPVALILVAGLVAVPVLLAKSGGSAPPAAPAAGLPVESAKPLTPITVQTTASNTKLPGNGHDPFIQQLLASAAKAVTPGGTASSAGATASSGSGVSPISVGSVGGGGTSSGGGSSSGGGTSSGSGGSGSSSPSPAQSGLTAKQSYSVSLALTDGSGGFNTINPLERLSILPTSSNPLLVELGVLQGGSKVLFVLQPGSVVSGPGACTPGPIDCEILALGEDQIESVGTASNPSAAQFSVTGISVVQHSSAAAANKARQSESAAGRSLLNKSSAELNASELNALSLFQYEPSQGAVVDQRNLTVGG